MLLFQLFSQVDQGKTQDFIDNIEPLLQYEAENKHMKEFLGSLKAVSNGRSLQVFCTTIIHQN